MIFRNTADQEGRGSNSTLARAGGARSKRHPRGDVARGETVESVKVAGLVMFQRAVSRAVVSNNLQCFGAPFLAVALVLSVAGGAHAQDRTREFKRLMEAGESNQPTTTHLGTFHIQGMHGETAGPRSPVRAPRPSIGSGAAVEGAGPLVPEFDGVAAQDLLRTFANARAAHAEGDTARAQRLFERVIATQPNGRLADAARSDLATLYRAPGVDAHGPIVERPAGGAERAAALVRDTPDASTGAEPKPRPIVVPRSRRVVMLERQFIADVGDRVFFASGRADLGARARDVIHSQAQWLAAHPDLSVIVQGHADDGTAQRRVQDDLSLKRAEAVRQLLIANGLSSQRVRTEAFGRSRPLANCARATCQAQNRRVVTVIADLPIKTAIDDGESRRDGQAGPTMHGASVPARSQH